MYVWNIPKSYSCELWVYHKSLCAQCESGDTAVFWTLRYFVAPLLFPHPFFTLLPKHPGSDVRGKLSQIRSHLTLKMEQNCQLGIQGEKLYIFCFLIPFAFFGLVYTSVSFCSSFYSVPFIFQLFCILLSLSIFLTLLSLFESKKIYTLPFKIIFPHQGCIHFINPIQ